jgi:hypothetical protein
VFLIPHNDFVALVSREIDRVCAKIRVTVVGKRHYAL